MTGHQPRTIRNQHLSSTLRRAPGVSIMDMWFAANVAPCHQDHPALWTGLASFEMESTSLFVFVVKTPAPAPLGCYLTPVQRQGGRLRRKGRDRQGSTSQLVSIRALPTFFFLTKRALNFLGAVSHLYTSCSPSQPIRCPHHSAPS